MSVYVIVSYDIEDPQVYESYPLGVVPLLQKHGAEILVADYEAKSMEGKAPSLIGVIKFESEEAVMDFYNAPEYQPLKKTRLSSTKNTTMILAKELVSPSE